MPYPKGHRRDRQERVLFCARSSRMSRTIGALYRFLYAGFLSRLPEPAAIWLGQSALQRLPLDRLPWFRVADPRLGITLGGVALPNPVILAAMYYDPAILSRAMGLGFGAVTAKSITVGPRPGHPQPNLVRTRSDAGPGLVNCNGFQNPGLEGFRASLASLRHRVPLIVSVAGESIADYVKLVRELGPLGDSQTAHRQALARFRRRERARDHSRRAGRRHPDRQLRQHPADRGSTPFAGRGRPLGPRSVSRDTGQRAPHAPHVRRRSGDHRHRRRRRARKGLAAAPRGGERGRLLHWIHHPRADPGAPDPRAPPRRPLKAPGTSRECSHLIHLSTAVHRQRKRTA